LGVRVRNSSDQLLDVLYVKGEILDVLWGFLNMESLHHKLVEVHEVVIDTLGKVQSKVLVGSLKILL
jgi:hypothetical protein